MKKAASVFCVIMVCLFLLSSCSGFHGVMYDHLSDPDNYGTYQAFLQDVSQEEDGTLIIKVTFGSYDDVASFLGGQPNREIAASDFWFRMKVTADNGRLLEENGFFEDVQKNDPIEIRVSNFIYMDGEFFYIAGVTCNGNVYLNFEDGLTNIVEMMDADRSLF